MLWREGFCESPPRIPAQPFQLTAEHARSLKTHRHRQKIPHLIRPIRIVVSDQTSFTLAQDLLCSKSVFFAKDLQPKRKSIQEPDNDHDIPKDKKCPVLGACLEVTKETNLVPNAGTVAVAYDKTAKGSPFRSLLVEVYAHAGEKVDVNALPEDFVKDMFVALPQQGLGSA
jgi:hypothetical protein